METLERENQELDFLEREIYLATPSFAEGLPAAGVSIFEQLVKRKAFQQDEAAPSVLPKITTTIESVCQQQPQNVKLLCFWLSVTCTLLKQVRRRQEVLSGEEVDFDSAETKRAAYDAQHSELPQLAKFDGSLTALVHTLYHAVVRAVVTDDFRAQLVAVVLHSGAFEQESVVATRGGKQRRCKGSLGSHLLLFAPLNNLLLSLQSCMVHESLIQQLFGQVFYLIAAHLFNYLSDHKVECVTNCGFQIKMELAKLEDWLNRNNVKAADELAVVQEAATIFVMDKAILGDTDVLQQACPSLSYTQVRHLLTNFKPSPPAAVLHRMKTLIQKKESPPEVEMPLDVRRVQLTFLDNNHR
eukprot:TRINITY_DN1585_c0_g1_i3.p1 TRINITY_DN1585_c0_g1~~TRINITY_DN1585_c0_g1_i3.p1  ORF type:complete len:356 (-),score=109.61 TRINITY_DN1585_c0_g1_i3:62-1129(-)